MSALAAHRLALVASLALIGSMTAACGDDTEPVATPTTASTTTIPSTTTVPSTTTGPAPPTARPVVTIDGELTDTRRDRTIPYRVYAPADGPGSPVPVVLVSHGGAGSTSGHTRGGHLGSTFAAGGLLAVHVGHVPSARPGRPVTDRPADVSFVLDELDAGRIDLPVGFEGTPDPERVAVAGHSFGAYTAHAVAGARFLVGGEPVSYRDERIDAIAPLSPQGPDQFGAFDHGGADNTWASVDVPVFALVGGEEIDGNVVGTVSQEGWRLVPFERYPGTADVILTTIAGQDHSDLWSTGTAEVEHFIAGEILEFLRVYLAEETPVDPCGIGVGDLSGADTTRRPAGSGSLLAGC